MALINGFKWEDGSPFNPPSNPLWNKWLEKYPPCPMPEYSQVCDGYSCMWCGRCPHGDYWKVPEEDKEVYDKWQVEYNNYMDKHGGIEKVLCVIDDEAIKGFLDNKD